MADEFLILPLDVILADQEFNCRNYINPAEVRELALSIQSLGQVQPINVRTLSDELKAKTGKQFQLLAGYRRYTAISLLNSENGRYPTIKAVVKECNDLDALTINASENISRTQLNIAEEAKIVGRFLDIGLTQNDIADRLGMSRGWVQTRLELWDLPQDVQEEVVKYKFSTTMIKQLHAIRKNETQLYEAVRTVKSARQRGEKITAAVKIERKADKRIIPKREDIADMQSRLVEIVGYGFHTRLLAWVRGDATDNEILGEARLYKDRQERLKNAPGNVG